MKGYSAGYSAYIVNCIIIWICTDSVWHKNIAYDTMDIHSRQKCCMPHHVRCVLATSLLLLIYVHCYYCSMYYLKWLLRQKLRVALVAMHIESTAVSVLNSACTTALRKWATAKWVRAPHIFRLLITSAHYIQMNTYGTNNLYNSWSMIHPDNVSDSNEHKQVAVMWWYNNTWQLLFYPI